MIPIQQSTISYVHGNYSFLDEKHGVNLEKIENSQFVYTTEAVMPDFERGEYQLIGSDLFFVSPSEPSQESQLEKSSFGLEKLVSI